MHGHAALRDNPGYIDWLHTVATITEDTVGKPITDEEFASLAAPEAAIYSYETQDDYDIIRALKATFRPSWNHEPAFKDRPEIQRLLGGLPVVFADVIDAYPTFYSRAVCAEAALREKGIENAIRRGPDGIALTHIPGMSTAETLSFPIFPGGVAYARGLRLIVERLKSDDVRQRVQEQVSGNNYLLLTQVQKAAQKNSLPPNKADSLGAFMEGYETTIHAASHVVLGGATRLDSKATFAKAVLDYTRHAPPTGLLGPMARYGKYFHNLTDEDGIINQLYKQVFEEENTAEQESHHFRYEQYIDPEDPTFNETDKEYERRLLTTAIPYAGEGCPGVYHRMIYNAAQLLVEKAVEISAKEAVCGKLPAILPLNLTLV